MALHGHFNALCVLYPAPGNCSEKLLSTSLWSHDSIQIRSFICCVTDISVFSLINYIAQLKGDSFVLLLTYFSYIFLSALSSLCPKSEWLVLQARCKQTCLSIFAFICFPFDLIISHLQKVIPSNSEFNKLCFYLFHFI